MRRTSPKVENNELYERFARQSAAPRGMCRGWSRLRAGAFALVPLTCEHERDTVRARLRAGPGAVLPGASRPLARSPCRRVEPAHARTGPGAPTNVRSAGRFVLRVPSRLAAVMHLECGNELPHPRAV